MKGLFPNDGPARELGTGISVDTLLSRDVLSRLHSEFGDETATDLVHTFIDDALRLTNAMKKSLVAGDDDGVRQAAHALKSTAALVGAQDLARASAELMTIMRVAKLRPKVAEVVQLWTATRSALRLAGYI